MLDEETNDDAIVEAAAAAPGRFRAEVSDADEPVADFTIEDVAAFFVERQRIWHVKERLGASEPWTLDPVMREWRICNIFREQDAGSRNLYRLLEENTDAPLAEQVLNTLLYRLVNRAEVWNEHIEWVHASNLDGVETVFDALGEAADAGVKVGSNTWRATSLENLKGRATTLISGLDQLVQICAVATDLKLVTSVIGAFGIGDFVAYQLALDLKILFPNLQNGDWIFVGGSGARGKGGHGGSMWMLKRMAEEGETPTDTAIRLRDTQHEWLPDWSEFAGVRDELTLEDVDNLACEFRKYWFKRHGHGSLRRYGPEPVGSTSRRRGLGRSMGRGTRASESADWQTPPSLFDKLNTEFEFTIDAAAAADSHVLDRFWAVEDDGLMQPWAGETVYVFPPMNELGLWTEKAMFEARDNGVTSVILSPGFTETRWFYEHVANAATEVRFIRGMVQFYEEGEPRHNAFQNSMVVIVYRPGETTPTVDLAYTFPGRVVVPKSGWTGWVDGDT